ncbi:CpaF family protein [Quadrisphaera sp. INWT6]|nr:CpaF family protein [Quadrisphaera sp. INWT6]
MRALRQKVADQLATEAERRQLTTPATHRELGRALISTALNDHADALLLRGDPVLDLAEERDLATAVFDAMFGLGRLQPLVDDPQIENIEITGCDNVWLQYADGRLLRGPDVADSDEELISDLQFLAAHGGNGERPFSSAHPTLDLQLHDGSRLAAMAWTAHRPTVTIRRHRYTDIDLAGLCGLGMIDDALVAFLSATVRAGKSVVVAGLPGAGKTTLTRALANALDPLERVCTIETEYELLLHHLPERHLRIVPMQARPGSGERTADGSEVGAVTLDKLVYDSLRHNVTRIVVGEVRGKEILPMFKAMQAGRGSLSTTHAESARDAVERLATCALEAGPHISEGYAYRQIAQHIDLIVQVSVDDQTPRGGRKSRYVSEVVSLERGEGPNGVSMSEIFLPAPDGRAVATGVRPPWAAELTAVGFDLVWLDGAAQTWVGSQQRTGSSS